jgi:multiple sugar transport system permease protein
MKPAGYSAFALREERWAVFFLLPFVVVFFTFRVVPSVMAVWLSVASWTPGTGEVNFVGLGHFRMLTESPAFWKAMANTVHYAALVTPSGLILALATAALVHHLASPGWRAFFEGALYLPSVLAAVSVAVLWRYLYDYESGLLNVLATALGTERVFWLGDPRIALIAVAGMETITGLGGAVVVFVAALAGIPSDLHDAAAIDGAGRWRAFVHVTLPLLTPAILYVAVVRTIGAFQVFVPVYLVTQGGPADATLTIGLLIWRQLMVYAETGLAAATGLALLGVTLLFTAVQFRWFRRTVEY